MAYLDAGTLRTYIGGIDTSQDALLTATIARAQSQIETETRRKFEAQTNITRVYPNFYDRIVGMNHLYLDDDLLSLTTLVNGNGSTIASSGYFLLPLNQTPSQSIRLKTNPSPVWIWNTDQTIQVTGTWGFSTTAPADIVQATLRLATKMWRERDSQIFDITFEPGMGQLTIPAGMPKEVQQLIAPYRRNYFG